MCIVSLTPLLLLQVFIVDTFQTFKKTATHKVGRVIVTTPQVSLSSTIRHQPTTAVISS